MKNTDPFVSIGIRQSTWARLMSHRDEFQTMNEVICKILDKLDELQHNPKGLDDK